MLNFATDPAFAEVRDTLSVTGLPILEDVLVTNVEPEGADGNPDLLGEYNPFTNTLWMREGQSSLFAAVHEYAHAVWAAARDDYELQDRISHVLDAVERERRTQQWLRQANVELVLGAPTADWDYLLNPNEVWARAVTQWVFDSPNQKPEYHERWTAFMEAEPDFENMQWPIKSFESVCIAFEAEFPVILNA